MRELVTSCDLLHTEMGSSGQTNNIPFLGASQKKTGMSYLHLLTRSSPAPSLELDQASRGCTLQQTEEKSVAEHQRKFPPLCQAPDGRPSHGNTYWRCWTDTKYCQGQNPLVGPLFPFLMGEHRLRAVLVEGSHGTAWEASGQVLTTSW